MRRKRPLRSINTTSFRTGRVKIPPQILYMGKLMIICVVGAPCSGKTTWIKKYTKKLYEHGYDGNVHVIGRDLCREQLYGPRYDYKTLDERAVTELYFRQLGQALSMKEGIVFLDNTHMREKTLRDLYSILFPHIGEDKVMFKVKVVQTIYIVGWWRNLIRRIRTGKWIPLKALRHYYDRYDTMYANPFFLNLLYNYKLDGE